jgi:hypothetical protein
MLRILLFGPPKYRKQPECCMPGVGYWFFSPLFNMAFSLGKPWRKKGWRRRVGKITEWSEAQRSNFDLSIMIPTDKASSNSGKHEKWQK